MKALSPQAAELLLEKPQPAPLLLPDADILAAASSNADASAAMDARTQDIAAANIVDAGAVLVSRFSANRS